MQTENGLVLQDLREPLEGAAQIPMDYLRASEGASRAASAKTAAQETQDEEPSNVMSAFNKAREGSGYVPAQETQDEEPSNVMSAFNKAREGSGYVPSQAMLTADDINAAFQSVGGIDKARAAMAAATPEQQQQMITDLTQKAQDSALASSKDRGYGPEHLQPVGMGQIGAAQVQLAKSPDGQIHALPHVNPFDPNSQKQYFEELANQNFQTTAGTKMAQQQMRNSMWEDRSSKTLEGVKYKSDKTFEAAEDRIKALQAKGNLSKSDAVNLENLRGYAKPDPLTGKLSANNKLLLQSTINAIKDPEAKRTAQEAYAPILGGGAPARTAPVAPPVRVKDPSGAIGTIPASQLNDAIKQGYVQVK